MYKPDATGRKAKDTLYRYKLQENWAGLISIREGRQWKNRNITMNHKRLFIIVKVQIPPLRYGTHIFFYILNTMQLQNICSKS